ncbi:MAG TPA: glycine zipper 2TM domain-containing protein [Telluria sp.]
MNQATTRFATLRNRAILVAAAVAAFGASPLAAQAAPAHHAKHQASCSNCAKVLSTHTYKRAAERGSGIGAGTGAIVGGLLGNQIGSGNGRTLATVAGAVGGSVAGNQIERHANSSTFTDIRVRMTNGKVRTLTQAGGTNHYAGEPVRVINGRVVSR